MSEHKYELLSTNDAAKAEFVEYNGTNIITDYRFDSDGSKDLYLSYDGCNCSSFGNGCYSCFSWLKYHVPCGTCLWENCYQTAECVCAGYCD